MKAKTKYQCSNCGVTSSKWTGRCFNCDQWETFVEISTSKSSKVQSKSPTLQKLSDISSQNTERTKTGINEFDRVLGGGIVPGSLILLGGEPGIGKSTLMLQICEGIKKLQPIYITGEESAAQIKSRAIRLKNIPEDLSISAENSFETIELIINNNDSELIIIDSVQSIHIESLSSPAGSIVQVREATFKLMELAKKLNKTIIIIGHITKDGGLAGPKALEHLVDTVLQFEGDSSQQFRIVRSIKNRFGSVNEIGIFEMNSDGLKEIPDPSGIFITNRKSKEPGIINSAIMEGSRPILVEIQSLVSETGFSMPQRISTGYDQKRMQIIISIIEKRLGIKFYKSDIFINIAGGLHLNDPAVDLGIALALISSFKNIAFFDNYICFGELSLTGEIRPVSFLNARLKEASKTGFKGTIIPNQKIDNDFGLDIIQSDRLSTLLAKLN